MSRWLPVGAAGLMLAGIVGFSVWGGGDNDSNAASVSSTAPAAIASPSLTAAVTPTSSTVPIVKTPISSTLSAGNTGSEVEMVQNRLLELKFDPGPVDGDFGDYTTQAVWAFEKLVMGVPRDQVTGKVTPELWDRMQEPVNVVPRRPQGSGSHVEIYLPEQMSIIFDDDQPVMIAHSSSGELDASGNPAFYSEKATWTVDARGREYDEPRTGIASAYAKTPAGVFTVHRKETGNHQSSLGGMTNPVYFNYGIALHGAYQVPDHPASHGCVRINQHMAKYFQDLIEMGDQVYVWGYDGRQPEEYSENDSLPSFDARTYDTTVPPTTLPTTTVPATETVPGTSTTTTPSSTTTTGAPTSTVGDTAPTTINTTVAPDPVAATTVPDLDIGVGGLVEPGS